MEIGSPALTFALALAAGVLAQSVARHLHLPGIVLLLLVGASLGPDGIGWVHPRSLGEGLFTIVDLAVAVILFEGGLNLEISRLRRQQAAIRRLITVGALVTLFGGTLAAQWLLGWSFVPALLFGSLVVVTGPTVVGPIVRELRLRPRLATVLEGEGVLIDPIGAILVVLVLEVVLTPEAETLTSGALALVAQLGFGVAVGVAGGFLLARGLRVRRLVPEGHENIFVLASILLLFQGADELVSHSGIVAVTACGVVVGNLRSHVDRDLREFKDQLTVMLIGLLFVLLAADVRVEDVRALGWDGLAVVGALILVVRPLGALLSTWGSALEPRDRLFVAWIAPRGIVAAALASLAASALELRDIEGGEALRALVFLTIATTVLLAGLTAGPVASLLRVRMPGRDLVAILGVNGLSFALAEVLRAAKHPVVFLDANPQHTRRAEEAGFNVVFGNALQERTLQRARFESVGTAIGVTLNETLNGVFVTRAQELFGVPKNFAAVVDPESGLAPEMLKREDVAVLFEAPHDLERWDVRSRHAELEVVERVFRKPENGGEGRPEGAPRPQERFVVLAVRRGKRTEVMSTRFLVKEGDVASVALYVTEREKAEAALEALGWHAPESAAEPEPEAEAEPEARAEAAQSS